MSWILSPARAGKIDISIHRVGPEQPNPDFLTNPEALLALHHPAFRRGSDKPDIRPLIRGTGNKRIKGIADTILE